MVFDTGLTRSNLDCFLHCTTPTVRSEFLPKSEIKELNRLWHPVERENVEYFTLSDLWSCFDEWSAYGAGVPVVLNNYKTLVQYYVPYLSAVQIFTGNSPVNSLREEMESGDGERDSFSESSCDESSESDKLWRWDGGSSEDGGSEQDSFLHGNNRLGCLYFQYFERSTPYGRVPLMDKIHGLCGRFPGLMSLRSVDLSPASWMAVAWSPSLSLSLSNEHTRQAIHNQKQKKCLILSWFENIIRYPIYHIPMGRTIKDLSTCFLTYHTLSSSFQDMEPEDDIVEGAGISVRPFGLATYKMKGDVWESGNAGGDREKLVSLSSVADSWLKQLRVQHHDFNYFKGIRLG
ncbi:hypothetical protein GQ457_15G003000 [Hibiscus cannabinus]